MTQGDSSISGFSYFQNQGGQLMQVQITQIVHNVDLTIQGTTTPTCNGLSGCNPQLLCMHTLADGSLQTPAPGVACTAGANSWGLTIAANYLPNAGETHRVTVSQNANCNNGTHTETFTLI